MKLTFQIVALASTTLVLATPLPRPQITVSNPESTVLPPLIAPPAIAAHHIDLVDSADSADHAPVPIFPDTNIPGKVTVEDELPEYYKHIPAGFPDQQMSVTKWCEKHYMDKGPVSRALPGDLSTPRKYCFGLWPYMWGKGP